jgi:hypothetical protein
MAKVFYTEHDIEDMVKRGERSLVVGEDVVLTDLAYEKARRLGMQLVEPNEKPPAAPMRPYLSKPAVAQPISSHSNAAAFGGGSSVRLEAIKARVKSAVKAQLGNQVDDAMLERIIDRVAADLGLK